MSCRPRTSGSPTWILRLKRPGRRTAASRTSSRFVAAITTMSSAGANPSSSTSSWLSVVSRSSWPFVPAARLGQGVELVDEDHGPAERPRLGEQVADPARADAHVLLDELRARDVEERDAGLGGDRAGEHRLAGSGRAVEQDAAWDRRSEAREALRLAQEVDDLGQLVLRLVAAGDVLEPDIGRTRRPETLVSRPRPNAAGGRPRTRPAGGDPPALGYRADRRAAGPRRARRSRRRGGPTGRWSPPTGPDPTAVASRGTPGRSPTPRPSARPRSRARRGRGPPLSRRRPGRSGRGCRRSSSRRASRRRAPGSPVVVTAATSPASRCRWRSSSVQRPQA